MTGAQPIHDLQGAMADRLWMNDASCREFDPDLWFPDPTDRDATYEAKRICKYCPVKERCEDYADEIGAMHGIFAGQRRNGMILAPRKRGSCGTPGGYSQHRLAHERACTPCRLAQRDQSRQRRAEGKH